MYDKLYRKVIFPFYDKVLRRRSTWDHYKELSEAPTLSREKIDNIRADKLARLVDHCRTNVPFYTELFEERGLGSGRVDDIEQLREHGITMSKDMVRAAGDRLVSRELNKKDLIWYGTSGSTGIPVIIYMTMDNWCRRMARKMRSEDWMGRPPGTRTSLVWGHHTEITRAYKTKLYLYWRFHNTQFLSAFDIGEDGLEKALSKMRRFGSKFIESYVTAVYLMAQVIEKRGLRPPNLDGIVIGAERLYPHQKEKMEKAFACPVYNRYGATEFSNIASECLEHGGQHINEDDVWVEVLDSEGRPVVDQPGSIVITDLTNYAQPLIRYRIGDTGIMSSKLCPCGRTFSMLEDITGRESEIMRAKDGRVIHEQYFVWELTMAPGLRQFQVVQKSLSRVLVRMEHDGSVERSVTEDYIRKSLAGLDKFGLELEIEFVDKIPLTAAGKFRSFISEVDEKELAGVGTSEPEEK